MPRSIGSIVLGLLLALAVSIVAACVNCGSSSASHRTARTLILAAYSTPREAYGKAVLPAFAEVWRERTGQTLAFRESYMGSGAQARALVGGFDADVAALALEPDLDKVQKAGLITHDWKAAPHGGIVTRSIVVIGVRQGNPKGIHDWDDLTRPDVEVLTPDVRMSGGARWNVAAIYGAALRGGTRAAKGDRAGAEKFLADVLRRVKVMDRGARASMLTFERGIGDAIVTYEDEIDEARAQGQKYDMVVPRSTLLVETPAAVVDVYVDRHGTRDLAEAFLAYLVTPDAQAAFAEHGFRPLDADPANPGGGFPPVSDLFTIGDLGGWGALESALFAPDAAYDRALKATGGHAP